jgi:hypothetical protein
MVWQIFYVIRLSVMLGQIFFQKQCLGSPLVLIDCASRSGSGSRFLAKCIYGSGSGSWSAVLRIPDPDFYPSWIPDLGSWIPKQQLKRGIVSHQWCDLFHRLLHSYTRHIEGGSEGERDIIPSTQVFRPRTCSLRQTRVSG